MESSTKALTAGATLRVKINKVAVENGLSRPPLQRLLLMSSKASTQAKPMDSEHDTLEKPRKYLFEVFLKSSLEKS
jgi:hypothetical protein